MTTQIPNIPTNPAPVTTINVPPLITADDFGTYQRGWLARDAAQTARIAELEQSPAPTPDPLAWGMNVGTDGGGNLSGVDKAFGGIDAVRWYSSAGKGMHYPRSTELGGDLGNRILIASYKLLPQDVLAGKHDAEIGSTALLCPADKVTMLALIHEPEDEIEASKYTAQQYRDAQTRFASLVHGAGNPKVLVALILMGYTYNGGNGRDWHNYYAGPGTADVLCTDEYAWGPNNPRDLSTIFAKGRAAADEAGLPFSVTETGADPSTFGTGQPLLDALTKLAQRAKAVSNGPVACYFGGMPGKRWDVISDPNRLAAWKAGQA
jgi:hypothetical protein